MCGCWVQQHIIIIFLPYRKYQLVQPFPTSFDFNLSVNVQSDKTTPVAWLQLKSSSFLLDVCCLQQSLVIGKYMDERSYAKHSEQHFEVDIIHSRNE